jgi:hypothetical protein
MREAKSLMRLINIISLLLIAEPLIKVMVLKTQTGLEWSLIWSNIMENSQTFTRFFSFWLLSPLTGIFLLTYSTTANALYFGLTLFKIFSLVNYEPFSWPYMSKHPHFSAYLYEGVNLVLMGYLFYPVLQRFLLSRYLRNIWDARGRVECRIPAVVLFENHGLFSEGVIQNISSGGVSLRLAENVEKATRRGKIVFYTKEKHPLSFDFAIKAHRQNEGTTILGLEFVGLSPREKIILRSMIKEQGYGDEALKLAS